MRFRIGRETVSGVAFSAENTLMVAAIPNQFARFPAFGSHQREFIH